MIFFHSKGPMPIGSKSACVHRRKKWPSSPFAVMAGPRCPREIAPRYATVSSTLHFDAVPFGMLARPPTAGTWKVDELEAEVPTGSNPGGGGSVAALLLLPPWPPTAGPWPPTAGPAPPLSNADTSWILGFTLSVYKGLSLRFTCPLRVTSKKFGYCLTHGNKPPFG